MEIKENKRIIPGREEVNYMKAMLNGSHNNL